MASALFGPGFFKEATRGLRIKDGAQVALFPMFSQGFYGFEASKGMKDGRLGQQTHLNRQILSPIT